MSPIVLLLGRIRGSSPLLYDELRRLAAVYMRRQPPGHTLEPTALVNEAYLKLAGQHGLALTLRLY